MRLFKQSLRNSKQYDLKDITIETVIMRYPDPEADRSAEASA